LIKEQLRQNGAIIVNQAAYERNDKIAGSELDSSNPWTATSSGSLSRPLTRSGTAKSLSSTGSSSVSPTSKKENHHHGSVAPNPFSTTFKDSYKPPLSSVKTFLSWFSLFFYVFGFRLSLAYLTLIQQLI
jgi:hypothetical protein